MTDPIYSLSRWLIFVCCCNCHTCNFFSFLCVFFLLNRMFAFMLHTEYTTSCFMAKSWLVVLRLNVPVNNFWQKVSYDTTSQASKTNISLFCSEQPFYSTVWMLICSFCLFVCQTASIFYSLAFQILLPEIFFTRKVIVPPILWFSLSRKRLEIVFRGHCQPRKLKSAKK